jgi:hypothetical protein
MPELLAQKYPPSAEHVVLYFYCSFRYIYTSDVTNFLTSILLQLCGKEKMFPELEKLFNDCQPNPPSRPQLLTALQSILKSIVGQGGSLQNVSEVAHHATEPFKTVTLILDGLEEVVAGDPLNDFLEALESLVSIQEQDFRIINISRKNAEIESYMGKSDGWTWSERNATEVELEIYEFAQFRISRHRKLKLQDIAITELICRELSKGAKGM